MSLSKTFKEKLNSLIPLKKDLLILGRILPQLKEVAKPMVPKCHQLLWINTSVSCLRANKIKTLKLQLTRVFYTTLDVTKEDC